MLNLDFWILDFIQKNLRSAFFDMVMPAVTRLGNMGMIWIGCTVLLLLFPKTRKTGVTVLMALILETICCDLILKPAVARIRPCDVNMEIQLLIPHPMDYSFPSGHTGASFAAASALLFSKNRLWILALPLAFLIAFSRLYLYVHYPSDVLAGIFIGITTGWLGYELSKFTRRKAFFH